MYGFTLSVGRKYKVLYNIYHGDLPRKNLEELLDAKRKREIDSRSTYRR